MPAKQKNKKEDQKMEWLKFWITAVLLILTLIAMFTAVLGSRRFGFILNRVHAAGISDTVAVFLSALAVAIGLWQGFPALKILLVVIFMWVTAPISAHFLGLIEYHMNQHLEEHMRREDLNDNN